MKNVSLEKGVSIWKMGKLFLQGNFKFFYLWKYYLYY